MKTKLVSSLLVFVTIVAAILLLLGKRGKENKILPKSAKDQAVTKTVEQKPASVDGERNQFKERHLIALNKKMRLKSEPELAAESEAKSDEDKKFDKKNKFDQDDDKKFDQPNKFAQYESEIKRQRGDKTSNYPLNYKMIELNKAVQNRFGINLDSYNKSYKKLQGTGLFWIERGPGNVSGRTRGMIVDPDDATGNTWFAASVSGGVWKTTNEGVSWTDLTPNLPNLATTVLAMAPSNHNIIYLGTGEGFYNADAVNGNGIFKSTDHGNTWNQMPSTANNLDFQNINRIIVSPSNANLVYACANVGFNSSGLGSTSGIFKSTDGGTTWNKIYSNNSSIQQLVANPQNFNTLFATVNRMGVIKSLNGGQTWNATQGIITSGRVEIAIAPSDTSRLYAAVESSTGSDLYISKDAGNNWTLVNDASGTNPNWLGGQGWYDNVLAVNPFYEDSLIVGGINLYKIAMVAGSDTVHNTTASTTNTSSFLGFINWGGPLLSGGAGTGQEFLGDYAVTDTDYVSIEVRFGAGISQKAHRFVRNSDGSYGYRDYVNVPFQVWDITHNRQLMVSFRDNDSSGVFKLIQYDQNNLQREYIFISSFIYDPNNPSPSIAQTNGMIYKNIYSIWPILAAGATWDPNNLPNSKISILYQTIYAKLHSSNQITNWYSGAGYPYIHADQHNIIIIPVNKATDNYRILNANDGGCAISDNSGISWKQITTYQTTQFYGADKNPNVDQYFGGMQDNGTWFSSVNPNSTSAYIAALGGDGFDVDWKYDDANMMIGSVYNDAFYKSTDGGSSWNASTTGLTDIGNNAPFITCLAKTNQDPDLIFSTGASGVWRSDNFGDSWTLSPISKSEYNSLRTIVSVSNINPQIVWAGGYLDKNDSLQVSTDGGVTFHPTNPNNLGNAYEVTGIATDPVHDSTAYILFSASQSPKILKTTDLGKTWKDISGFGAGSTSTNGFPDVAVYSLLVMPTKPDTIWAGTEIGLFQSTDGGTSWQIANNGLPAVSIWSMKIVGDQVVVATHGRGIWSVQLPWLSGYTLPKITKSPRVNYLAQGPSGMLTISLSFRSQYDSSKIDINRNSKFSLNSNNSVKDSIINIPVTAEGFDSVQIVSYKSGKKYFSSIQVQEVHVLQTARSSYINNFNTATSDFSGTGFSIGTESGFTGSINSPHPYSDNTNNSYELLVPIKVASTNATLSYDDVAIVEPGDNGSVFGSVNFYDYVIVEGSADGINWVPLSPGYDCRSSSAWLSAWNSNGAGDSTMFVHHDINLLNTFSTGQNILIRFRLFADEYTHGWGWTIDNLSIQPNATGIASDKNILPINFELSQNYPNPFNPSTVINFQLPVSERVTLIIYNSLGQRVKTLVDNYKDAGYYHITWDGRNDFQEGVASGVYFYRIHAGKFISSKKMVLLK